MKKLVFILGMVVGLWACTNEPSTPKVQRPKTSTTKKSTGVSGAIVYKQYCTQCHGMKGNLMLNGANDFAEMDLSLEERIEVITNGRNTMTPYKDLLSEKEIQAVAKYLQKFMK